MVHEACLSRDKNDSDKTVHNSLEEKSKYHCGALHSHFSLFYTIKEIFLVSMRFSGSIYRVGCSVYEVSYPCSSNVSVPVWSKSGHMSTVLTNGQM